MSVIAEDSIDVNDAPKIADSANKIAQKANGGVVDINDPNTMTPSEKVVLKRRYDTDNGKYNFDVLQLRAEGLPTADLDSAMSALTAFLAPYLVNMSITEPVDRDRLNKVLTDFDKADKGSETTFTNFINGKANSAIQAGNEAKQAGQDALLAGQNAQKSADDAKALGQKASQDAQSAQQANQKIIDDFTANKADVAKQIADSNAKVEADINSARTEAQQAQDKANQDINKAQSDIDKAQDDLNKTASQLSSMVLSKDFQTYRTQTDKAFQDKASNGDLSSVRTQLTTAIDDKVSSKDFNTYRMQTDQAIQDRVSTSDFNTERDTLNGLIADRVTSSQYESGKKQTAELISQSVGNAINNLSVGGTNLIKNSKFDNDWAGWRQWRTSVGATVSFNSPGTDWDSRVKKIAYIVKPNPDGQYGVAQDNVPVEPYTDYVVRLRRTWADGELFIQHGNGNSDNWEGQSFSANTQDCVYKFKTGNTRTTNIYIGFNDGSTGHICVSLVKMEKGNIATDWSLSPLDTATSTDISQLSNAIRLKADSNYVDNQLKISTDNTNSTIEDKITGVNTLIGQTKDDIMAKVNGLDGKYSNLKVEADGIQTDVGNKLSDLSSKVTQTDKNWQVAIGNLSIGGTNLIKNSKFDNDLVNWRLRNTSSGATVTFWDATYQYDSRVKRYAYINKPNADGWTGIVQDNVPVEPNTTYTLRIVRGTEKANTALQYGSDATSWNGTVIGTGDSNCYYTFKTGNIKSTSIYIGLNSGITGTLIFSLVKLEKGTIPTDWSISPLDVATQTDITASLNNIHMGFQNPDGSKYQFNMNSDGNFVMDMKNLYLNGNTNIMNGTIGNAQIADGSINNAKIANASVDNAKIADLSVDNAKIKEIDGSKIFANSIGANQINVTDLIANGIHGKTIDGVTINGATINTPDLDLGLNGIFTEDYDYTQDTSYFLPKKASGKLTFTHGVLQSDGNMQTYSPNGNNWGGINNDQKFVSGLSNDTWTELGPGYLKLDMIGQSNGNVINRLYADPTGLYYNNGRTDSVATHISSSVYTQSVSAGTVVANNIGIANGLRLNMVPNGKDWGLSVGSYDGSEAVLSDFINNFTVSNSSNVYITSNGHLGRSTSASKYKFNINNPTIEDTLGDRLLNVHLATWNDKYAVENYARSLSDGSESENLSIKEHYGLIAEQLRDAGLSMFLEYGNNNEIEGIQYDRAWIPLLPVIRRLKDKVLDYEQRISKLEAKINE